MRKLHFMLSDVRKYPDIVVSLTNMLATGDTNPGDIITVQITCLIGSLCRYVLLFSLVHICSLSFTRSHSLVNAHAQLYDYYSRPEPPPVEFLRMPEVFGTFMFVFMCEMECL